MPDNDREIVDLNKLPGNSRKTKVLPIVPPVVEDKTVKQVTTGKVIKKEKSFLDKFSETFFGDDSKTILHYVIWDVAIPAAKNTISDMVQTGIDMLLFGESRGGRQRTRRDGNKSYVSYGGFYNDRDRRSPSSSRITRSKTDDIVIESRGEAEEVLSGMMELIEQYGSVTVADFYTLVGEKSEFTDDKYGWVTLNRAHVDRTRDGYVIMLPRPIVLD